MTTATQSPTRSLSARPLVIMIAVTAALLAAGFSAWNVAEARQHEKAVAEHSRLQSADGAAFMPPANLGNFVQHLPQAASTELLISQILRASNAHGASFGAASIAEEAASDKMLGRVSLSLTLRGTYPRIKTSLAEVTERFPGVAVTQLALRRAGATTEVEARIDLLLATRPLMPSASTGS